MSQTDLASRAVSALNWSYAGALSRVVLQLVVQVVLARLLGPGAFGEAMVAIIVIGVGWLLAEAGFGSALVQKSTIDDGDVGYALGWLLLVAFSVGAVVIAGASHIAALLGNEQLAALVAAAGLLIPLQALSNLPISLLQRQLRMKRVQMIQTAGYLFGYGGVGIGCAISGYGAWSLIAAYGAQTLFCLIGCYASVRHTLRPRLQGDASLRRFGLTVSATNLTNWSIDNVDRMFVSRLWGADALGLYSVAANFSKAPLALMVSSVQTVAFSSASRVQSDSAAVARGYLAALSLTIAITAPMFAFLGLHAEQLIQLLYGDRWLAAAPLYAAFCTAVPFLAALSVAGTILRAVNLVHFELVAQLCALGMGVACILSLSGQPLVYVAWVVPVVSACRALMVHLALARRLELSVTRTLSALRAGALLSLVPLVVWIGERSSGAPPSLAFLIGATSVIVLSWACLRVSDGRLLSPELNTVIRDRWGSSRTLAVLGSALGMRRGVH